MKDKKKYIHWGLTVFLAGCALLIFYDVFYRDNSGTVQAFFSKLSSILAPILYGLGMAYLLAPIVNFLERLIRRGRDALEKKRGKTIRIHKGWLRVISIFLTWSVMLVLLYLLFNMLIPELVESITTLVNNLESYYNTAYTWGSKLLSDNPELTELFNRYYNEVSKWLNTELLPGLQTTITNFTGSLVTGVWSIITFAKNFLIGIIVSVYLLAAKEKSTARCCKLIYGVLPEEKAAFTIRGFRRVDRIFSGFVRGKLLDSLIIGHSLLHRLLHFENALYAAGQRHCRRDQCYPLLWSVFGRHSLRRADFAGGSAQMPVFCHLYFPAAAVGRQCHRSQNFGRVHGHFQPVGHRGHFGGRRLRRCAGYVFGRAHLCLPAGAGALAAEHPASKAQYASGGLRVCQP